MPLQYTAPDGTTHTGESNAIMAQAYALGVHDTIREVGAPAAPAVVAVGSVDPNRAERIAADVGFMASQGWTAKIPGTWFDAGTEMMDIGKDTYRSKARVHAELPPMVDAFRPVIDAVAAEHRRSFTVDAATLRLTDDGRIYSEGKRAKAVPVEPRALHSLVARFARALPRARALLDAVEPDLRAELFNRQMSRLGEDYGYRSKGRETSMGVRRVDGALQVFRAVSPSYLPMPLDKILGEYVAACKDMALPDLRGVVDYNPRTTDATIRASWHAPETFDAGVGDTFEVGIVGRTNDAGGGAHSAGLGFTRVICINCTVADWLAENTSRRHRGSRTADLSQVGLDRIREDVGRVVSGAATAGAYFLDKWGMLRATDAAAVGLDLDNPVQALTSAHKLLPPDVARDVTVELLLAAYEAEPGTGSVADVINAVSRAAHDGLLDQIGRWRAERAAGELIPVLANRVAAEA